VPGLIKSSGDNPGFSCWRYKFSDRHRDHAACRVTPATSPTYAHDPPSAKDRADTPRDSPTNALKRSSSEKAAGSDECARASTA
jgi:hypothetical protein